MIDGQAVTHKEWNEKGRQIVKLMNEMVSFAAANDRDALNALWKARDEIEKAGSIINAKIMLSKD